MGLPIRYMCALFLLILFGTFYLFSDFLYLFMFFFCSYYYTILYDSY
jgi:hypothetical protein